MCTPIGSARQGTIKTDSISERFGIESNHAGMSKETIDHQLLADSLTVMS